MNREQDDTPIQDRESITISKRMTIEEAKRHYPDASGLSDESLHALADEMRRREETT